MTWFFRLIPVGPKRRGTAPTGSSTCTGAHELTGGGSPYFRPHLTFGLYGLTITIMSLLKPGTVSCQSWLGRNFRSLYLPTPALYPPTAIWRVVTHRLNTASAAREICFLEIASFMMPGLKTTSTAHRPFTSHHVSFYGTRRTLDGESHH